MDHLFQANPALRHLYFILMSSSKSLRRLMADARRSADDPSPVLRVALAEASNVSKAASRLASAITEGNVINESSHNAPPTVSAQEVFSRLTALGLDQAGEHIQRLRIEAVVSATTAETFGAECGDAGAGAVFHGPSQTHLSRRDFLFVKEQLGCLSEIEASTLSQLRRQAHHGE